MFISLSWINVARILIIIWIFSFCQECNACGLFLIFIVFCQLDFRGPRWFPAPATPVLSSCARLWRELHDRRGEHTSDHIRQRRPSWRTALSHGILLCLPPHIPQVHFNTALCYKQRFSRMQSMTEMQPPPTKKPSVSGGPSMSELICTSLCNC